MILMFHQSADKLASHAAAGNVGRVHLDNQQTTGRIDEDMSLPGLDRLAPSKLDATDDSGVPLRLSPVGDRDARIRLSFVLPPQKCVEGPLCSTQVIRCASMYCGCHRQESRGNLLAGSGRDNLLGPE
jgi:hypothetical protein